MKGKELVWAQLGRLKRTFDLSAGYDVIATLRFQRSTLVDAEAADQR